MAFVIYKKRHKGRLAETISRQRALLLEKGMRHPDKLSAKDKKYVDNIKQLSIPKETFPAEIKLRGEEVKNMIPTTPIYPSGKDRAAGDS